MFDLYILVLMDYNFNPLKHSKNETQSCNLLKQTF